jgi:hypothetical protein
MAIGQDADLKSRFESEYRAWKEQVESQRFSSAPEFNEHFTKIVKMGIPVLPLIIDKMEKREFSMDFLLESAFYLISRKDFEKEDWPKGKRGDSHTAAAMYIEWWHNGIKDTQNSFDHYYRQWKRDLAEKKEDEANNKLLSIRKLGIVAMPFMIDKIKKGDLKFVKIISDYSKIQYPVNYIGEGDLQSIKIISDYTSESLNENASKDECIAWWNENKDKFTIVQDE